MEDGKENLEEGHANMHEVVPQSMHIAATEKEDFDEETFWDELEMFCSSLDIKQSTPSSNDNELQQ